MNALSQNCLCDPLELIKKQYHPQSGIPAYFLHPCNTASAMKAIVGEESIEPENYLLTWLGLIGSCINLNLSSRLFMKSSSRD